ncbi:MAG TPA: lysine-sensitive aspartokinase 3, partial [Pyrinomonadaceae bacterium]|nr:lysine-sensitive aspartokinase 3 [Pyrinomonadaceae bacterium]
PRDCHPFGGELRRSFKYAAHLKRVFELRFSSLEVGRVHHVPTSFHFCREKDFPGLLMSIVMKFGGTSVADAAALNNVAAIVAARLSDSPVVVVSAMSGVTDALLASSRLAVQGDVDSAVASLQDVFWRHKAAARELLGPYAATSFIQHVDNVDVDISGLLRMINARPEARKALNDQIVSNGELLSSALFAEVLRAQGIVAEQVDPRRCLITNDNHGCASPVIEESFRQTQAVVAPVVAAKVVPVIGGFVGASTEGNTTTLGRGGSDYTAALLGAALKSDEIQIWTDVTGVLTADPRVVSEAQTVERLSYGEAAELAYFGAKVLHPKTIQPAIELGIKVRICNSRKPQETGTLVCAQGDTSPGTIKAIAHKAGITTVQVTSARMLGAYGFLRALFEVFDRHRTVVDVVTTSEVSVSLSLDDAAALPEIVKELEQLGTVRVEKGLAIICIVGEGLHGVPGIVGRVFSTISDISVSLISQGASSINFTFVVEEGRVNEAVRRLHREFFEADGRSIGVGT